MIELHNVVKRFGRKGVRAAVQDISAHVPQAEVWAVVGPNGAGKSTLLSLVLGFVRPTAGTIRIDGDAPRDYVRTRGAAYLPERFRVPDAWTVRASLRLFAGLEATRTAVDSAIARLGLEPFLEQRTGTLSRGMLQRLGLAQALLVRRELVVLDEPTEGLDPIWRIRFRDIVRELRDAGCTVLLASHDLVEVERVADRALVLESGTVRDVLDTRATGSDALYRIDLHEPFADIAAAFPDANPLDATSFTTVAGSAAELSERVAALIAAGGIVIGVNPLRQPLEERVRDVLTGGNDA